MQALSLFLKTGSLQTLNKKTFWRILMVQLAEPTEAVSNQTHFKEEGEPLMKVIENSIGTGGAVLIIVGVLFACVIIGSLFV